MAKKNLAPLPTSLTAEAERILNKISTPVKKSLAHYYQQEDVIDFLFRKNSLTIPNVDPNMVLIKSTILNEFYGTQIKDITAMATAMLKKIKDFDTMLVNGNVSLVDAISKATSRCNTSFASKYCACHQPTLFPILDGIVGTFLATLIAKGNLAGYSGARTTLRNRFQVDYAFYKDVYDAFMKQYGLTGLTYRQVDNYIWWANKLEWKSLNLFKLN